MDPHLSKFIEELRLNLNEPLAQQQQQQQAEPMTPDLQEQRAAPSCSCGTTHSHQLQPCAPAPEQPAPQACAPGALLPPQLPQHQGKMTVLLDLDGTLVSSFTPRR